jgi:hypothetical protein
MRNFVLAFAALALITSSILIGAGPPAYAATTCSGTGCDGIPAANTTCVNDAYIVESYTYQVGGINVGNLQLKYSPSCQTTWARVVSYVGESGSAVAVSHNYHATCNITGGGTGCNTGMTYVANLQSYAKATVYSSNGTGYTWQTMTYLFE